MDALFARLKRNLWPLACLLVLLAYLATVPPTWQCEGTDEIEYLGLAHSLVRGEGYTLYGEPYVYYPPLYSTLLSLVMRWDVTAWRLMYLLNAALGFAGVIVVASYLRRFGPAGRIASWFSLFSYYAWSFSTRYLMSDPLFTLCAAVALVAGAEALGRSGKGKGVRVGAVAVFALLAAMTRSSSIALVGALALSGFFTWRATRNRAGLWLIGACVLAAAFIAYWEIRAVVVDPHAPESSARWALKLVGLSTETTGYVATSIGTGTTHETTYGERLTVCAVKAGQYVASMTRRPSNAEPLAILLFALFLAGVLRSLPRSPFGWYALWSILMISFVPWYTDYLRYLYALTPLLFYFAWDGALALRDALAGPRRRAAAILGGAWAACALAYSFAAWPFGAGEGSERLYTSLLGLALAVVYAAALAGAVLLWKRDARPAWGRFMPPLLVAACLAQSAAMAAARFSLTRQNAALNSRNLEGCVAVGRWLGDHAPADASCVSSVPRLMAFLADRTFRKPVFDNQGRLDLAGADYLVLTGELVDVPFFRSDQEARLWAVAADMPLAFAFGDAAVYKVGRQE